VLTKELSSYNKEYLPMTGTEEYKHATQVILFGEKFSNENKARIISVQSFSGTGALRLGTEFMARAMKGKILYLPNLTWANHKSICEDSGIAFEEYPYYDRHTKSLDYENLLDYFNNLPPESVILLHAIAHNPTGVDPTQEQWRKIMQVFKDRNHFAFFDCAYQGFASGDAERDGFVVKLWAEEGLEMMIAQSFSKNFGLYNERIGAFHIVTAGDGHPEIVPHADGYMARIVRAMYSSPSSHGALIIQTILTDADLRAQWKKDLETMANRLLWCRQTLFEELVRLRTPGSWDFIIKQIGMFTFTGLTQQQVTELSQRYHIYLLQNGRISLSGVNSKNVLYIAQSIHDVVVGPHLDVHLAGNLKSSL
jgi:aspartate/tyrosine/aromatic aminotransferase